MQNTSQIKESVALDLLKHIQTIEAAALRKSPTRKETLYLYAECLMIVNGTMPEVAAELSKIKE